MKAIAEAPGKVIISGEHFVVHGATALAASINRSVRVEASRSTKLEIVSNLRDGESLCVADDSSALVARVTALLRSPADSEALARRCQKIVQEQFSHHRFAEVVHNTLDALT